MSLRIIINGQSLYYHHQQHFFFSSRTRRYFPFSPANHPPFFFILVFFNAPPLLRRTLRSASGGESRIRNGPGPGRISLPEGLNPSSGCSFTARAAAKVDSEADEYDYESETDKASMLDEAIEYLKQLQLQVQMLTMRNGLSLYPICLPGMLQPNQISQARVDIYDTDKSLNVNTTKAISVDQNISANALLRLQDSCVKQAPVTDFPTLIGSKTSFELEPSTRHHFGSFQISRSSNEKVLPCQPLNDDCPQTSSAGASKATSSIPFETEISNLKENTLEVENKKKVGLCRIYAVSFSYGFSEGCKLVAC
ncbi:hypothetical protein DH2020_050019 [Rehmannia glutinosa]|uniref:Uncharacterized protein n=1 Tax=Rehmannia glutinosa TaxID=99300 RepID=A0ABR0U168_REHGL